METPIISDYAFNLIHRGFTDPGHEQNDPQIELICEHIWKLNFENVTLTLFSLGPTLED